MTDQMLDETARLPPVSCEESFRGIVVDCLLAFDGALAVFLETDALDGPHKARVALRRLTTCLDVFSPILRRKRTKDLRIEAKGLFRSLGLVRDMDVYVQGKAGQPGHDKRLQESLALRQTTRAQLRDAKAVTFSARALSLVQPEGALFRMSRHAQALAKGPVSVLAHQVLNLLWQDCLGFGDSVSDIPRRDRHEFRKELKRLRYASEFFADVLPELGQGPFRSDFCIIQDALGELNDYEVALKLDRRRPPQSLPAPQAAALETSDAVWSRLAASVPPWRDTD